MRYRIVVRGSVPDVAELGDGSVVVRRAGGLEVCCEAADPAALTSVLERLTDVGTEVISLVAEPDDDEGDEPADKAG